MKEDFAKAPRGEARREGNAPHRLMVICLLGTLVLTGCGTPAANPSKPHANTGYVDFYTDSPLDLSWEIKRGDQGELQTVFSDFDPVPGTVLRLAGPPGTHKFEVWVMNRVTEGPQSLDVSLEDGKITPVHVTLTSGGKASVDRKVYGFRPSAKGYGRGTKIVTDESAVYKIGAVAESPRTYQQKEQMHYYSAEPK
jgi:hypothetical protein